MPSYTVDPPVNIHFIVFSSLVFNFSVPKLFIHCFKIFPFKTLSLECVNCPLSMETLTEDFTLVNVL
jgi:hypothetical protein